MYNKNLFYKSPDVKTRLFTIEIVSENLKSTLNTTSDVIHYFYNQRRLFHPNEVEMIRLFNDINKNNANTQHKLIVELIFQTEQLALMFFLKSTHIFNQKNTDVKLEFVPDNFANTLGLKYIYRHAFMLDVGVLQRPTHQLLDPEKKRNKSRYISRWNGICTMNLYRNRFISFFVYNQPYSDPKNKHYPLYQLPQPIIERFELSRANVENYYIEENSDCVVIDFSLSDPPIFYQYGFIATDIKSDKERLCNKYHTNDEHKLDNMDNIDIKSVSNNSEDNWLFDLRAQQRITAGGDIKDFQDEAVDIDYYKAINNMEQKINKQYDDKKNDVDIIDNVHKSKHICPYIRVVGYCEKYIQNCCPYLYHPQMEKNVDFGNNKRRWDNPNNCKIIGQASARRQPTDIDQEFLSYIVPGDTHIPYLYLQDIIHNCFILRITMLKCQDYIRKDFYERKLSEMFPRDSRRISTPTQNLTSMKQTLSYPLLRRMNINNEQKFVNWYISPLKYTKSSDLYNASYRASMIDFIERLNSNYGEYHLEAFCLMACLINYPPMFIIEDFHVTDYNLLEKDVKHGEPNKVWQVLKKLSEGNIDTNKWRTFESSGKGGSGRGKKGFLDKRISTLALSCRERYCKRGNGIGDEGRNISFMNIYIDMYFNVDFLNQLKQQELGYSKNRYEWIKCIKITPLYYQLEVDQEKSCRMFRLKDHLKRSAITFLRVEFQSAKRTPKWAEEWEYGTFTRQQVYNFLTYGMSCGGAKYDFFFFSDGQLRDKKCWMYSVKLSRKFNSIKGVRNIMGNFENIRSPGKKMARMGLYNTKSTQIATLKASEMEFVDDPKALDGEPLTDGCSIINQKIVNEKVDKNAVSMLARLGGAKCMLIGLPSEWIRKVIEVDQKNKQGKILKQINEEQIKKNEGNKEKLRLLQETLQANENRNFNAQVVITKSSNKFEFDKYNLEVAIKEETSSSGAFTNKEFIGVAYYHYYLKNSHKQFEKNLQSYAMSWFDILNHASKYGGGHGNTNQIDRGRAEIFLNCDKHKGAFKFLLKDMAFVVHRYNTERQNNNYRRFNRFRKKNKFHNIDNIQWLTNMTNESDRCNALSKQAWTKAVKKLHIHLPWPSCRVEGVADWTGILLENEIFLKISVPMTVSVWCKICNIDRFQMFDKYCPNNDCRAERPKYYVHEGKCGLLKNPCLHPRSYKLFTAKYYKKLDKLFDGECLLFSTNINCKTSPVFAMSGADLDGDDFLIVTQQDLLPLTDLEMELKDIKVQNFDEQGEQKLPEYIDDYTIVDYFLEYQLHENTAELSQLHEAYSEHYIQGIGHEKCLSIAKYHSFALDFPKTGKAAIFPKNIGIPMNKEINQLGHCIYPHYMSSKPAKQKFHSTMIKGRMYDFVLSQVPSQLKNDFKFRKEAGIVNNDHQSMSPSPFLRDKQEERYNGFHNYNKNNYYKPYNHNINQYGRQQRVEYKYNEHKSVSSADNNNNNNNNNNIRPRARHENIDDEYHWIDAAMHGIQDFYDNNKSDNDNNVELDMQWIQATTYDELKQNIETEAVKCFLKPGESCTIKEINQLRKQLDSYRQLQPDEYKRYEALHVDMYYEIILQEKKSKMNQEDEYSSDNIHENEELKQSTV